MVRRTMVIGLVVVLAVILVACGGSQTEATTAGSGTPQAAGGRQFDFSEMPLASRLPEQAQELLPLWQMLRALQESGTASQAESDAVLKQIQEAMTPEQLAAIEDMDPEEMRTLMQDLGMGQRTDDTESSTSDRGGGPPDMGGGAAIMGGGEMPMGGMPFGGGQAQGTPAAGQGTMGGFGTAFIEQVIELLEARAAEA
jgi:hypothetical protein